MDRLRKPHSFRLTGNSETGRDRHLSLPGLEAAALYSIAAESHSPRASFHAESPFPLRNLLSVRDSLADGGVLEALWRGRRRIEIQRRTHRKMNVHASARAASGR